MRRNILLFCAFILSCGNDAGSVDSGSALDAPTSDALVVNDAPSAKDARFDSMLPPLDAAFVDAGPPPPDNCAEVTEIVLDGSGLGTATGSFSQVTHDYSPAAMCPEQTPAPDAVYTVQIPAGSYDVAIDTFGSTANTILGIGLECSASGLASACNDDADAVGPSRLWLHQVAGPAQFYILVAALDSSESGSFQLNIHRTTAHPDACINIGGQSPLDITGGGTVVGVQQATIGTNRGTCMPGTDSSGEAIFRWTAASNGTASFVATSFDFNPYLYVREASCGAGTELGCVVGVSNSSTANVNTTASTTYYTFVDGGSGTFSLHYQP